MAALPTGNSWLPTLILCPGWFRQADEEHHDEHGGDDGQAGDDHKELRFLGAGPLLIGRQSGAFGTCVVFRPCNVACTESSWPSPASTATTAAPRSSPGPCATPASRSSTPACTRRPSRWPRPSIQEDADAVGLSLLSGAHMTLFPRVLDLLAAKGAGDVLVFGGGIIPEADIPKLKELGVAAIFTPRRDGRSSTGWGALDAELAGTASTSTLYPPTKEGWWTSSSTRASSTSPASASRSRRAASPTPSTRPWPGRQGRLPGRGQGPGAGGRPGQGRRHQAGHRRRRGPHARRNILGMDIKGHVVRRLWVEHASDIAKEYYASFTLDRAAKKHLGMVSAKGGVDIEQVAAEEARRPSPGSTSTRSIGLTEARPASWSTTPASTPRRATVPSTSCSSCTAATSRATPTWSRSTR